MANIRYLLKRTRTLTNSGIVISGYISKENSSILPSEFDSKYTAIYDGAYRTHEAAERAANWQVKCYCKHFPAPCPWHYEVVEINSKDFTNTDPMPGIPD